VTAPRTAEADYARPRAQIEERLRNDIRHAIIQSGAVQADLAAELGITEKHLSHMLTGRAQFTLAWADRIAALCGRQVVVLVLNAAREETGQ
jgi:plasmid maintenance system antidote protein VapI